MITTKKIKGMEIEPPKKAAFQIETDPDFMKLHCLCLLSGRRGGGKSVAVANLIRLAKDKGYFDKVWLITPTYYSNKEIWDIAKIKSPQDKSLRGEVDDEPEVFEPTRDVLRKMDGLLDKERKLWEEHLTSKKRWKEFEKDMKRDLGNVDGEKLVDYYERGFMNLQGAPKWKYKHDGPGRCAIVIDDAVGTDLYNKPSSGLTQFCISHRHRAKGVGCSVFMLVQSYCCKEGVPRPIRENCTHLCLFKLKDENQLDKIHKEIGCDMNMEKFDDIFKHATEEPYCFLTVDFCPKEDKKQFRKNFNEYLY
tara:strand:+ start:163 stop:1083 length:921 start_codon:yes stop_codon:yes gene_type:complete